MGKSPAARHNAGRNKCLVMSRKRAMNPSSGELMETIPPAGRERVWIAATSRMSASTSSGMANKADTLPFNKRSKIEPGFAAAQLPIGTANSQARSIAAVVSNRVFRARFQTRGPAGLLYANENPQSPFKPERSQYRYLVAIG